MSSNAYFEFVSQDYINKYITTSAVVFLVYDIILNLVSEYHFIWRTQWGAVKSLYYFARYGALINLSISFIVHLIPAPSHKICEAQTWLYVVFGPTMFSIIVNTIFVLRIRALYNQSRKVLLFLVLLVTVEFALEMYGAISTMLSSTLIISLPGVTWRGCSLIVSPEIRHKTLFAWIPCLCVALTFFVMTSYKCLVVIQKYTWYSFKGSSSLLHLLAKDGTIYFLLIFCICLVCTLFVTIDNLQASSNGPIDWFMALYSLAGSRLILNLRMAAAKSKPDSTTSEQISRTRHTDYDVDLGTIFTFRAGESSFNTSIPC